MGIPRPGGLSPFLLCYSTPPWVISQPECVISCPKGLFPSLVRYSPSPWAIPQPSALFPTPSVLFPSPVRYSPSRWGIPSLGGLFPVPLGYSRARCVIPRPDGGFRSSVFYSPSRWGIPQPNALFPIPGALFPSRWDIPQSEAQFPIPKTQFPIPKTQFPIPEPRSRSQRAFQGAFPRAWPSPCRHRPLAGGLLPPPNRISPLDAVPASGPAPRVTSRAALPAAPLPRERARVRGAGPARSRPVTR